MGLRKNVFGAAIACSGLCVLMSAVAPAYAQNVFNYNNGYGETIDPTTGVVTGGTIYTASNQVQDPYLTLAGSTTQNVVYGDDDTAGTARIYSSFTVAAGTNVNLNSISFQMYVTDSASTGEVYDPTTQDPFAAAHIAVYDVDPNNFNLHTPAGIAAAHSALVGGDDTFTTNVLNTNDTGFTGNYRFASTAAGGNGPTDTSMPVFNVGLNLNSLNLTSGIYFFVVSVDVNETVAADQEAYAVIADATDPLGQPFSTNGDNGIYYDSVNAYGTDQPEYNGPSEPQILDAFPYLLNGDVQGLPEPGSLGLLGIGAFPLAGAAFVRRRHRLRDARRA